MINKELLKKCIDEKLVVMQKHPELDLYIYNYTNECQYSKNWNEITLKTRGLILDSEMNVVSKSFTKFFNLSEHKPEEIPNHLPFEIFTKEDGSLLIVFYYNNEWIVASKGSFTSEQAIKGRELLKKYNIDLLNKNKTYCFEIIYPQNMIVIYYGDYEGLKLLAAFDNKTGVESSYDDLLKLEGFEIVERHDGINDLNILKELPSENKEGFVIRFSNGFRCKSKFDEYVRLHRIVTGVSNVTIWKYLSEGKPFDELIDRVPDEWYKWLNETKEKLLKEYNHIYKIATILYEKFHNEDRKEFALSILNNKEAKQYSSILFAIYSDRLTNPIIWKMIRPKFSKPFALNNEEL